MACFGYSSVFWVRLESTKAILLTKCWIGKPIYLMVKNNTTFSFKWWINEFSCWNGEDPNTIGLLWLLLFLTLGQKLITFCWTTFINRWYLFNLLWIVSVGVIGSQLAEYFSDSPAQKDSEIRWKLWKGPRSGQSYVCNAPLVETDMNF